MQSTFTSALSGLTGDLLEFTQSFLETALWAETDDSREDGGEPFDQNYCIEDFSQEALEGLREDCKNFFEQAALMLGEQTITRAGFMFWFNRYGHETGFWDDSEYPIHGDALDKLAESFGKVYLTLEQDKLPLSPTLLNPISLEA